MELAYEQHGNQDGHDDDDTTHGGHAFFLGVVRVGGFVALGLYDSLTFQQLDEPVAEPNRNNQSQDDGSGGTEGDVVENTRAGKMNLLQIIEEIV
jgi:hypothetical protein